MAKIRRDDEVMVIAGKDKGKTGKVLRVFPKEQKVLVEKINVIKKAVRPSPQYPQGGFIELEAPIHLSNVMLVDKKTARPTRVGFRVLKDGSKVRVAKRSGEVIS